MQRIRRASLILLMLCSMCAVFIVQAGTALADNIPDGPNGPGGEFCGGDTGFPCPTPANPAPAQAPEQPAPVTKPVKAYQTGLIEGERAGETDTGGLNATCPEDDQNSDYCRGWRAGYEKGQKSQQQGKGRKDIPAVAVPRVFGELCHG